MTPDPSPWSGLDVGGPLSEGSRTQVWAGSLADQRVAVRRSRRPAASLAWELDLMGDLDAEGFLVPTVIAAEDGRREVDGIVVQRWLEGRPPTTPADWVAVAGELRRLHEVMAGRSQRPDCASVVELRSARRSVDADLDAMPGDVVDRVLAVFESMLDVPRSVIHGDPGAANIRIDESGRVGFLDWDESRVDLTWHDLSNLDVQVLDDDSHARATRLSNAWEAANGWVVEPDYARRRLAENAGDPRP